MSGYRTVLGILLLCLLGGTWAQDASVKRALDSSRNIHDPAIIRQGDTYYLFATGNGIPVHCSADLRVWDLCSAVFFAEPAWLAEAVPGLTNLWAPDISYRGGVYYLYYAASTFGSNRSVIGLATNTTLEPGSPNYRWEDRGLVIESYPEDPYNAIDPNAVTDREGRVWLSFGSYWTGIKLVELEPTTGKPLTNAPLYDLATRPDAPYAVEAPFIVRHAPLLLSVRLLRPLLRRKREYLQRAGRPGTKDYRPLSGQSRRTDDGGRWNIAD